MQRGALVFVVAALGLAAGFGLAKLGGGDPPATPPVAAPPGPDGEADALRARLRASENEREALEAEVALLREALALAGASAPEPPAPRAEAVADAAPPKGPPEGSDSPWFDAEGLASQGVGEAEIEALRARFEQYQMDELYLRDEAVRDGWFRSDRYRKSLRRLRNETRTELGDEDYDLLLYATGRSNRVAFREVLESSPARDAGLEPGDLLLRYDDARVFGARELQRATTNGREGDLVAVDVLRNGEERRFYVPRGPLGVRLEPLRRAPEGLR